MSQEAVHQLLLLPLRRQALVVVVLAVLVLGGGGMRAKVLWRVVEKSEKDEGRDAQRRESQQDGIPFKTQIQTTPTPTSTTNPFSCLFLTRSFSQSLSLLGLALLIKRASSFSTACRGVNVGWVGGVGRSCRLVCVYIRT